ncbi:MAG TPA: RNA polymerase sigma factor [Myxococcales bacterium]|jgi:RNA polymerase sigma-70 factor (ECF subfamily)
MGGLMDAEGLAKRQQQAGGPLPDEEVVERVLAGDRSLFEVLMRRHDQRVYRAVRGLLPEADAEDAMQQAWVSAYTHLREFRSEARFFTWIVRIAVHEALARMRRGSRMAPLDEAEDEVPSMQADPEVDLGRRELAGLVERAVAKLPELYRVVFMLREIEGMDTEETAEALGVTEWVVKTRLHRARTKLQAALIEEAGQAAREAFAFEAPRCNRVVGAVMQAITRLP